MSRSPASQQTVRSLSYATHSSAANSSKNGSPGSSSPPSTSPGSPASSRAAGNSLAQLVAAEQWTGQIAFDFIADGDGQLRAIECNPRITSGLHLLAHQPGLVGAFLGRATADIDAEGAPRAMLGTSMLLALPGALRTGVGWRAWLADYWAARDVGADWRDPLPMVASRFLWMAWVVWRARRLGVTPQQAATVDVEYNGQGLG